LNPHVPFGFVKRPQYATSWLCEHNQFWKLVSPEHQIIRDDHYMHSQNATKESQNLITSQKQK
jgi:hypothetical protein